MEEEKWLEHTARYLAGRETQKNKKRTLTQDAVCANAFKASRKARRAPGTSLESGVRMTLHSVVPPARGDAGENLQRS